MAWEWLAPVANTLFAIWQTTATVATGALCPPCVPVVSGIFTVGGVALKEGLKAVGHGEQGMSQAQFAYIHSHLENITDIVTVNQGMIRDVQNMIKASAEENRKLMKEMRVELEKFGQNMNHQFVELKSFIVQKDFLDKIDYPIQMLWEHMERASASQTKADIDEFVELYKEKSAKRILEEFILRLPHPHSNPLFMAMDSNVFESRKIMDDFLHVLSHFFVKVLAIEGFYHGVADVSESSANYMERLSANIDRKVIKVRDFVANYKMREETYWPGEVKSVVQSNLYGEDASIADRVHQKLQGIYTNDVFSIFAWTVGPLNHGYPIFSWLQPKDLLKFPEIKSHGGVDGRFLNSHPNVRPNSTTRVFVLRSTRFHEIAAETYALVRAAYRAHAYTHNVIFEKLKADESSDLYGMSYISHHERYFPDSYKTYGFAVWGAEPAVRYTNKGYGILRDEDLAITNIYTALSWV